MRLRFALMGSISVRARMMMRPLPVRYADLMPFMPMMRPAVGKSGPLMMSISSPTVQSGWSSMYTTPSITSPMLCGGMLVAMPTAMPPEPLTSRLGKREGSTSGCISVSSKLG